MVISDLTAEGQALLNEKATLKSGSTGWGQNLFTSDLEQDRFSISTLVVNSKEQNFFDEEVGP